MNFDKCETSTKQSIIVLQENRSRLVINNSQRARVRKILVDGCAITEGKRCDFLIIDDNNSEYFVELKGCDVEHAVEQLETTIKKLGTKTEPIKRHSIVISTRCPIFSPKIQKISAYFRKNLMSELIIKNNYLEINL